MKDVLRLIGLSKENLFERLNSKTKINGETGCWEWVGYTRTNGTNSRIKYGLLTINKKRGGRLLHGKARVHRISAWIFLDLDIYDSTKFICHKCDNPICWNPTHIYIGDAGTNGRDRRVKNHSI